jgi:hypothetical protein
MSKQMFREEKKMLLQQEQTPIRKSGSRRLSISSKLVLNMKEMKFH